MPNEVKSVKDMVVNDLTRHQPLLCYFRMMYYIVINIYRLKKRSITKKKQYIKIKEMFQ